MRFSLEFMVMPKSDNVPYFSMIFRSLHLCFRQVLFVQF